MSSLTLSVVPRPTTVFSQKKKRINTSHRRPLKVRAVIDSNLINYAEIQIVTWVLPIVISGRFLGIEYKEISPIVLFATIAKFLYDNSITPPMP